jgi:hypothetical protein
MDIPNRDGNQHPLFGKWQTGDAEAARRKYYSPEFETELIDTARDTLFGTSNTPGNQSVQVRQYEDYRKASNLYGQPSGITDLDAQYYATYQLINGLPQDYRTIDPFFYNDIFTGNMGGPAVIHYCTNTQFRMLKKSPIKPPTMVKGVS